MIVLTQAKPHGSPLLQHANADICRTHVLCSSDHFLRNSPFPLVGSKCCFATRTSQGESKISCFIFVAEMLVHNTLLALYHRLTTDFTQFSSSIELQHCASFYRVLYTTLISRTIEKEKPF